MHCPNCKKSNSQVNKFCAECGSQLGSSTGPVSGILAEDVRKDLNPQEVEQKLVDWTKNQLNRRVQHGALLILSAISVLALAAFGILVGIAHHKLKIHESQAAQRLSKLEAEERAEMAALEAQRASTHFAAAPGLPGPSAATISAEVQRQLDERLKDRKFVELEVVDEVRNQLASWTKDVSFFVGIPVGLGIALFGFLGAKSYTDLKTRADSAIADFNTGLENSRQLFRNRTLEELERIKKEYQSHLERLEREAQEKMEQFYRTYTETAANLMKLVDTLKETTGPLAARPKDAPVEAGGPSTSGLPPGPA